MLDSLYENIGGKIKNWAKWIFIVEAIGAVITGIALAVNEDALYIFIAICGPIVAWVGSWILYAFGELVEDIHALRYNSTINNIDKNVQILENLAIQENNTKSQFKSEEKSNKAHCEPTEEERIIVQKSIETVIPNKNKYNFSCPKCGCSLKFGQKICLCSLHMDWSSYK